MHAASLTSSETGNFFLPGNKLTFTFNLGETPPPETGLVVFNLLNAQGRQLASKTQDLEGKNALEVTFEPPALEGFYKLEAEGDHGQLAHCTLGVLAAAEVSPEPDPSSRYGTVAHLKGMDDQDRELMLDLIKRGGLGWIREGFLWHQMEKAPGEWTTERYDDLMARSLKHGICVLPVLCFGTPWAAIDSSLPDGKRYRAQPKAEAWQNYIRTMIARYGEHVHAWEIWNEPNLKTFWQPEPNAPAYAELMSQASATIREVAPGDTIITSGFSPCQSYLPDAPNQDEELFVRELVKYRPLPFDALGDHPYTSYQHGVSLARTEECFNINLGNALRGLDEAVDDVDSYPMWLTEMGVSTIPHITTEMQGAGYLTTVMTVATAKQNVERIIIYNFRDVGTDPTEKEDMFGLLHHDYTPKPGYFAVSTLIKKIGKAKFVGRETDEGLIVYRFEKPDGGRTEVLWTSGNPVEYVLPAEVKAVTDVTGCLFPVDLKNGVNCVSIGTLPIYLDY
ncbi:GH39 family glycosyl hydrolase [Cerasicoccus frondis]|uniref:GH39 family glycosyl hydrolase n=1 Tax=Cerasicoccus frondis TaxID=490090 RepID=UPI002852AC66|nr:hypothetical protein [Cerasicoccus frondis]